MTTKIALPNIVHAPSSSSSHAATRMLTTVLCAQASNDVKKIANTGNFVDVSASELLAVRAVDNTTESSNTISRSIDTATHTSSQVCSVGLLQW